MGGQQRIYKQRIASTQTLAKVFRAMEMIAASRIGAARRAATELGPYEKALTQAVAAVAIHTDLDHPLTRERHDTPRVAVLVVASDRGWPEPTQRRFFARPNVLSNASKKKEKSRSCTPTVDVPRRTSVSGAWRSKIRGKGVRFTFPGDQQSDRSRTS